MPRSDDLKNRLDELFSSLPQPEPEPASPPTPQPAGKDSSLPSLPASEVKRAAIPAAEKFPQPEAEPLASPAPDLPEPAIDAAASGFDSLPADHVLNKRVRELNCLNDIGHKIDEKPSLPVFFEWVTRRIPEAFEYADVCVSALEYNGTVFGDSRARTVTAKMVGGLRVGSELVGWLHVAYLQPHGFIDAESALLGSIVSRVSSYIETQSLLERYRTSLKDTEEAQRAQTDVAAQLSTIAKVSTTIASILDPGRLIESVANLTKETFGLYHAQLYLLDSSGSLLTLAAGASEVGQIMVEQGWKIPVSRQHSLVARAARDRQGVIVNDVMLEIDFMTNELLPETRSEMAIPLIVGDKLLGVLDVQSEMVGHFKSEDISIMTALASQVAMAMHNAQVYEEVRRSESLVRSIIDATPDWIYIKDRQHRYRLANNSFASAVHIPAESFIGKNDLELGFPIEMVRGSQEQGIRGFWADDRQVMETGEQQVSPNDPATIDGEVRIFHTIKTPLRDEHGEVWAVLAFARDVTERERMLDEMSEQARAMAELNDMASRLNLAQSEDEVLEIAGRFAARLLGIEQTSISLLDHTEENMETTFITESGVLPEKMTLPVSNTGVGKVILENRLIVWPEEESFSKYPESKPLVDMGVRAIMGAPLQVLNQVIGVLSAARFDRSLFSSAEKSLMAQIAALTSSALQIHRLLGRSSAQARYMAQLNEMAGELNLALNDIDVLTVASIYTCKLMDIDQVSVSLLDSTGENLDTTFINENGVIDRKMMVPVAGTGAEKVIQENRLMIWPDDAEKADNQDFQHMAEMGIKAMISAPLQVLGQVIGVLSAPRLDRPTYTAEEKSLVSQISALTSSALQIHRLVDDATAQANREHILHEISTRVRTAVDADTILRTAVRELGDALGRKTFIQLGGEVSRNGR